MIELSEDLPFYRLNIYNISYLTEEKTFFFLIFAKTTLHGTQSCIWGQT